jgi:hypothetical protein
LKASAVKVTESTICQLLQLKTHQCGDTGKPVLDIGGTLGTAAVNDQSITPGDMTLGVDTVALNLPDSDLIPVLTPFTIAGETGSPVHTVTARTGNPTTSITFTPQIASGVTDNAVITFYPFAGVYADWLFLEESLGDYVIKVHGRGGGLTGDHLYFENSTGVTTHPVFIDADGGVNLGNVTFNDNENTAIVMRGAGSSLRNVHGTTHAGTLPIIKVDANRCVLSGIDINGSSNTGPSILVTANGFQSRISDVYFLTGGAIDVTAASGVLLTHIYQLQPTCGSNTYAIDLGDFNTLDHAIVNGVGASACHGIRAGFSHVSNAQVLELDADGITTVAGGSHVIGCTVGLEVGSTGTPYVLAAGTIARDNLGYLTATTASDNANGTCSATLNSESGLVTMPNVSTAANGEYVLLVSNSLVTTNSRITVSVARDPGVGGDTGGRYLVREVQLGTGAFAVPVKFDGNAQNGTIRVAFVVTN